MPLSTFRKTEIPEKSIVKQSVTISGFGGERKPTLGYISVDLTVVDIRSAVKFHIIIIEADTSYHVILGRAWQHRYAAIPSSYHQCMKAKWGGKTITVDASERPFEVAEAHLDDAVFFTELSTEETAITAKPRGIKIPRWEDIKDQHDDEEVVLIQKRGSSNSKPFKQPARRYHPDLEEKIKEEIEKLRAAG